MVRKANDRWRMCTNYTNLNKACPKDAYPLPIIDRLVDGAARHQILSFLDVYFRYKIFMHPRDEEIIAFITESTNYCFQLMPFDLKNAGAIYQHLTDKIFKDQISKSMEVYVDDMVIKSKSVEPYTQNLQDIFSQIQKYNMRLNPEKCVFGYEEASFWVSCFLTKEYKQISISVKL